MNKIDNKAQKARDENTFKFLSETEEQITSENRAEQFARPDNISFGKFKNAEELLKAYNSLQTQFTKRSQRLSELIKENRALKEQAKAAFNGPQTNSESMAAPEKGAEYAAAESDNRPQNMVAEDETGNATDILSEKADVSCAGNADVYSAEAERFLKLNPSAKRYVGEIADRAALTGDLTSGFLERAFIGVLSDKLERIEKERENDENIYIAAVSHPAAYEKVIKKYLKELKLNGAAKLIVESGLTATAPPIKPKSIEEAGALASSIIKQKGIKI